MKSSKSCRIDINFGHVISSIVQDGEFPSCVGRGRDHQSHGTGKRDDRTKKKKTAQLREWSGDTSSSVLYTEYFSFSPLLGEMIQFD